MCRLGPYQLIHHLTPPDIWETWFAIEERPSGFRRPVTVRHLVPPRSGHDYRRMDLPLLLRGLLPRAALSHPGLVQHYAISPLEDHTVVVREFVPGMDLGSLFSLTLERSRPLELAVWIIGSLCETLRFAHKRVGMHADLTMDHVLIS